MRRPTPSGCRTSCATASKPWQAPFSAGCWRKPAPKRLCWPRLGCSCGDGLGGDATGWWYLLTAGLLGPGVVRRVLPQLHRKRLGEVGGASEHCVFEPSWSSRRVRFGYLRPDLRSLWPNRQLSYGHRRASGCHAADHACLAGGPCHGRTQPRVHESRSGDSYVQRVDSGHRCTRPLGRYDHGGAAIVNEFMSGDALTVVGVHSGPTSGSPSFRPGGPHARVRPMRLPVTARPHALWRRPRSIAVCRHQPRQPRRIGRQTKCCNTRSALGSRFTGRARISDRPVRRRDLRIRAGHQAVVLAHTSEQNSLAADLVQWADRFPR